MLELFLICTVAINAFLAISVLLKNSRNSLTTYYYFLLSLCLSIWVVSNAVAEIHTGDIAVNSLLTQVATVAAYLGVLFTMLFCRSFIAPLIPNRKSQKKKFLLAGFFVFFAVLSFTHLMASSVTRNEDGILIFSQGPLVLVYALVLVLLSLVSLKDLRIRIRHGNYVEKTQARFIAYGLVLAISVGMVTNVLLPAIFPEFQTAGFGTPLLTLLVTVPIGYALIKHRLLDVRPIAARITAFTMLLITLGVLYSTIIINLNEVIFEGYQPATSIQFLYILIIIALGFLVHPLYKVFWVISGRLFLHHIYEPQNVINELNGVLVANLHLKPLMLRLQKVIRANIDTKYTIIHLSDDTLFRQGDGSGINTETLAALEQAHKKTGYDMVSIRDIVTDPDKKALADMMLEYELAIMVAIKHGASKTGLLYISEKSTGLPYTNQDLDIIKVIVAQAGLAIQNALLFQEVSQFNVTLQQKVSDATRELRSYNAKLVSLDVAKDEFISMASHQLRTPLTSIKGYLSMVLDGDMGKLTNAQRPVLEQAYESSQRMVYVVGDLLNFTRMKTGSFVFVKEPVAIDAVAAAEAKQLQKTATAKGLQLIFSSSKDCPVLMLDENKIRQVIMNFMDNAIFYTPVGGTISVTVTHDNEKLSYIVTDNGAGVPKSEQHLLFTKFYRAANARKIRPDGTGLGLYMAKKIIKAQGGTMLFKTEEGKGSTFGFSFPIKGSKVTHRSD